MNSIKGSIPWWGKIGLKILFSRIPLKYSFWRKFNIFKHGDMYNPEYSYNVVIKHMKKACLTNFNDKVVLEMGPGDSLFTALIASAYGAKKVYLVDVGDFAIKDINKYKIMADYLCTKNLNVPDISLCKTVDEILELCNAEYLIEGLQSYNEIIEGSIDFIFSNAVLEHIRKSDFTETFIQLKRIMVQNSVQSHVVDLRDHLGSGLNNLRFKESIWESDFMAKSGFYTNRIRFSQIIDLFKELGFTINTIEKKSWDSLPIKTNQINRDFINLSIDDLKIQTFHSILKLDNLSDKNII